MKYIEKIGVYKVQEFTKKFFKRLYEKILQQELLTFSNSSGKKTAACALITWYDK